jgi:hypothetical protein
MITIISNFFYTVLATVFYSDINFLITNSYNIVKATNIPITQYNFCKVDILLGLFGLWLLIFCSIGLFKSIFPDD